METLAEATVTTATGIHGDFRGALKPGRNKRQVTLMTAASWREVLAELGTAIPWEERRVNLLVEGLELAETTGARLLCERGPVFHVMGECDPCSRMEQVSPGLKAALMPHWRGGVITQVAEGGQLRLGDWIRIEQ